jgi:nucleotide-binding universal stress UspA family protein
MADVKQIVVGVDGSESSRRALRWAYDEALAHHSDLVVLTAWTVASLSPATPGGMFVAETDVQPEKVAGAVLADALHELPGDVAPPAS